MTEKNKREALAILEMGIMKILNNYTESALLINACCLAKDRYLTMTETTVLSTTSNIPSALRLDNEVDVQYNSNELVKKYSIDIQNRIAQNYTIISISLVDAILEDLYQYFLKLYNPQISEIDLEKKIRNSWTDDNLMTFFNEPQKTNLQKPKDKDSDFTEAFMRYSELRIVRHTLLHTNGKLTEKNYKKLQDYLANTPELRRQFAIVNSRIITQNRKIALSMMDILSIRQYLDRFLMYLIQSLNERPIPVF